MLRFALGLPLVEKRYSSLDQGSLAMANQRIAHYTLCGAVEVEEVASVKSKQDDITAAYCDQTTRRMRYFVIDLSKGLGGFGERRDFQCSEKKIERSGQLF